MTRTRMLTTASAIALFLAGGIAFALIPGLGAQETKPIAPQGPAAVTDARAPFSFADLVERVSPAVVTVLVEREERASTRRMRPQEMPDPFREFFERFGRGAPQAPRRSEAMGSGFIIDEDGYIVTNNHVVDSGTKITVRLSDGREFEAKLIGKDEGTDVAVIKVESGKPLPYVELGDDSSVRVGDWVVAVGNPFGLGGTVTAGIVSSMGRDIGNGPYTDFIQIDAPINRGNSGGPTFDVHGRVIGMNTAIFSPSGGSVGIGFAIPSSVVRDVVAQLKEHGEVTRGWLGVFIQSVTEDMAAGLDLEEPRGAIVTRVTENSPAEIAGFRQGDVILDVNGRAVEDSRDLTRRVGDLKAGEKARFTVLRDGEKRTLTAEIAKRDEDRIAALDPTQRDAVPESSQTLGLDLSPMTPMLRRAYNLDGDVEGVVITGVDPESEAFQKGIREGEVIVSIGSRAVRTPEDVERGIKEAQENGRKTVLLLINGQRYVALKIAQA